MTTKPNDVRVISDAQPADQQGERIDQLKARCDELENLLLDLVTQHDLPIAARNLCNAALSKPSW
ncbi:hypothetical protein pphageT12_03 [Pseudomonas phage pphageT12]|nr:hypothetical protein pphageT21_03 [Pseudomonas phage pphageT21]UAW53754.1 hypothetical protein pphageT12_03 [Pseudomonas phage pphageT12]UAW53815.1 hypothetical protein pphageBV72_03 [Pseudomonas phage pphageBV72]